MKKIIITLLGLCLSITYDMAGTSSSALQASSKINASCVISATTLSFGSLAQNGSSVWNEGTGQVSVLCNKSTSYSIDLALGQNGSSGNRYLLGASSGQLINYTICQTQGFTQGVGCASNYWYTGSSAYSVTGTGDGNAKTYTMYGYAKSGYYTPDTYTDTTTAIVTY